MTDRYPDFTAPREPRDWPEAVQWANERDQDLVDLDRHDRDLEKQDVRFPAGLGERVEAWDDYADEYWGAA